MFGHRCPYALVPDVSRCAFASRSCVAQPPPLAGSSGRPETAHRGTGSAARGITSKSEEIEQEVDADNPTCPHEFGISAELLGISGS